MRGLVFFVSFLIAFLLFVVQPMATRLVLPTLGGTPAVWNTAMLTFQLLLLAGYAYAHLLARRVYPARQWQIHAVVALAACLLLPLQVSLPTSDAVIQNPAPHLILALVAQLGLPFFCLAATAPLLQSWVSRSGHPLAQTPYVLYSASNLGSFAALIGYIALVEPVFTLSQQRLGWSLLFVVGVGLLLLAGQRLAPRATVMEASPVSAVPLRWQQRACWIWLAFLPSSLSLGVTTYIATDIASVPLLWVVPFSLYLLSFVDAFRTRPLLVGGCLRVAPWITLLSVFLILAHITMGWVFLPQLLAFAVVAFALHGMLARLKPTTAHLTQFYFCLSIGGALGGLLNGLLAPMLFSAAWEFPVVMFAASVSAWMLIAGEWRAALPRMGRALVLTLLACALLYGLITLTQPTDPAGVNRAAYVIAAVLGTVGMLLLHRRNAHQRYAIALAPVVLTVLFGQLSTNQTLRYQGRNFFGIQRVTEAADGSARFLMHDTTLHGVQSLVEAKRLQPLSYYAPLRSIMAALPAATQAPYAVIGMGLGMVQCYAQPQQSVDFFEINPMVIALASNPDYFTYLRDCPGTRHIYLGDGRIRLAEQPDGRYGLIVIDAFSSDAIPSHLLTTQALASYRQKLTPEGVLLFHITNRHIDLWPLLRAQADRLGMVAAMKFFPSVSDEPLVMRSTWLMIGSRANMEAFLRRAEGWQEVAPDASRPWTDDYMNILPYMKIMR